MKSAEKVLIVGLGNVGMGYDIASPDKILTHARAFSKHEKFELIGGVDSQEERRRVFREAYQCPAFKSIDEALSHLSPSIVVIAVPTAHHYSVLTEVLKKGRPKAILCEKPLALDRTHAKEMVDLCQKADCRLFVNYMRRSDVGALEVMERIRQGTIKTPLKGLVWYSKGLFNSASHFLNLLELWLGQASKVEKNAEGLPWEQLDPQPDFCVTFDRGTVQFMALDPNNFFHNTMEFIAPNGRLRYEQGGAKITWEGIQDNQLFTGYKSLGEVETLPSDFGRVQWHVANELYKSLQSNDTNICTGNSALSTINLCQTISEILI